MTIKTAGRLRGIRYMWVSPRLHLSEGCTLQAAISAIINYNGGIKQ